MFDKYRHNGAFLIVFVSYYKYVLECKLVVGNIVISLDSEFVENNVISNENQDCETNAFKIMAERIKKNYPKLSFIASGDALYATTPIIELCEKYN
ncbi:MAG: hypothetical protein PHX04_06845 [Bacilli bacterium]|nr:hypothetical protein [Bacilli bacterium]